MIRDTIAVHANGYEGDDNHCESDGDDSANSRELDGFDLVLACDTDEGTESDENPGDFLW